MKIVVCIKQVPHPDYFSKVTLDPVTRTIRRSGIPCVINPLDKNAIEAALQIREVMGGSVTLLTMGPPQAKEALEEGLSMGADEGVLLTDRSFAGADTLATAYVLAAGIRKIGSYDLIICGNESLDGGTCQVPGQIAEYLGIPHVTRVIKIIAVSDKVARVSRAVEFGIFEIEVDLPAVLAVLKQVNTPRLPTVSGILEASSKPIVSWDTSALPVDRGRLGLSGSPTQVVDVMRAESGRKRLIFDGDVQAAVRDAIAELRKVVPGL